MTMKYSGRTQALSPRYPILQAIEKIKELGFDGVEVCLEVDEVAPDVLTSESVEAIRSTVEQLELHPVAVGYHKDYVYDDNQFLSTQTAIRLAPQFGSNLLIFSGTARSTGDQVEWDRMLQRTRTLVQIAEDHDVILAQEFEPGFIVGSTQDLLQLLADISSPNLKVNLDLGHVFLCDADPLNSIRQLGSKIVHGHVENMAKGIHRHRLPQEGDMDLRVYLRELEIIGFTGALSLDLYDYDYEKVSLEAIDYLRSL